MAIFPVQPWRCLWRGFLQMTRTTFLRFTILQSSHRRLTEALTFMVGGLLKISASSSEDKKSRLD
jgi:hypothetical protein